MGTIMAKALNSTLGTSNFKSFDVLLYDVLKRIQMESKTLKYSETDVIMPVTKTFRSKDGFAINSQHVLLMSFTMPHSGEVGLEYDMGFDSKSDSQQLKLEIYKNGVLSYTDYTSASIDTETHDLMKIAGNGGDLIEIKTSVTLKETGAASTSTKANIYLYNICATILDASPVKFS